MLTVFVCVTRHSRALTAQPLFARITARATRQVGMERVSTTFLFITAHAIKARGLAEMTAQYYTVLMTVLKMEFVDLMAYVSAIQTSTV